MGALFQSHTGIGSPATVRVVPEYPVLRAGVEQRTVIQIIIEGKDLPPAAERSPVNLALVIDTSGSMRGDRIENARKAALEVVSRLDENDIFSLITYDSTARTLIPSGRISDRAMVERTIRNLEASGMTALYDGVDLGASELRRYKNLNYPNRMILLSDGRANRGPSRPEELARLGEDLGEEGIVISTVGLGLQFNEDLMTQLADRSGGNAYFAKGASDLPAIVDEEIGQALAILLDQVVLEIQFPTAMLPTRIIGRPANIQGQTVQAALPSLYSRQSRHIFVEVEIPAQSISDALEIENVHAIVRKPGQLETERILASTAKIRFSENNNEIEASLNESVQVDRLLDEAALVRSEAIALQDAGKNEAASDMMRKLHDKMANAPAARSNQMLSSEAESVRKQSEVLQSRQLNREERIGLRSSSYQQLNRQTQN